MRRWSVVLCVALLGVWATAVMAGEPPVPIEGKLLVSQGVWPYYLEGSSDHVVPLAFYVQRADISPLGDQVTYDLGTHYVQNDVWKADLDGSNAVNLTASITLGGINCAPQWSPDASQIAFDHCDPVPGQFPCETGFEVWVMNADSTGAHQVTPEGGPCTTLASWAPNGYRLLCDVWGVGAVTIDTDGTDMQLLPNVGAEARLSPDGSKIACDWYVEDTVEGEVGCWRQLGLTNSDGSNPQVLVQQFAKYSDIQHHLELIPPLWPPERDWFGDACWWVGPLLPEWSPRGDRIAVIAALPFDPLGCCYYAQDEVWIYNLPTADLTKITADDGGKWALSWNGDNTAPEDPEVTVDNTTVTFSEVTGEGLTTIIRDDDPPALPGGYQFCGEYYNITTTAPHSGPITITMTYKDEDVPGGNEEALCLLHYNESTSEWEDITISRDPVNNVVTGQTESLSVFGLGVMPIFGGFRQPINADGSSVFNGGRTIPVKFGLTDPLGNKITDAVAHLSRWWLGPTLVGTVPETATAAWADAGDTFRYDPVAEQYIYNLSSKGMAKGTWVLQVTVEGWPGFEATVLIGLR